MKFKETIEKAYGSIPKEATPNLELLKEFEGPQIIPKWLKVLFKKKKKNEKNSNH